MQDPIKPHLLSTNNCLTFLYAVQPSFLPYDKALCEGEEALPLTPALIMDVLCGTPFVYVCFFPPGAPSQVNDQRQVARNVPSSPRLTWPHLTRLSLCIVCVSVVGHSRAPHRCSQRPGAHHLSRLLSPWPRVNSYAAVVHTVRWASAEPGPRTRGMSHRESGPLIFCTLSERFPATRRARQAPRGLPRASDKEPRAL